MNISGFKLGLMLWAALVLAGCAVGPDFVAPDAPKDGAYTPGGNPTTTGDQRQSFKDAQDVEGQWWQRFGSPTLNQLIETGLKNNPSVLATQASLDSARAKALAEKESLFVPSVEADLMASRQKFSTSSVGQPGHHYVFNLAYAQVGVTYNLDLFGGNRRQLEAFMAQADASEYLFQAARMTLVSNMVTTSIREAGLRAQINELKKQIQWEQEILSIARAREASGAISAMDVKSQEVSLANLAANLPPLVRQLNAFQHQLSVYLGRSPGATELKGVAYEELKLPADLPVMVPSLLVRRRPDVLVSEANLHQATAELGVTVAAVYPNLSLSANYGEPVWNLSATLLQPLFNGGALENSKNAAEARVRQAAFQYQSTVLSAFQSVADTLRALESDADLLKHQTTTRSALESQLQAAEAQYRAGGIAYITLIQTRERLSQAEFAVIQTETNRLCDTAALYLAMGGGWWNREQTTNGTEKP